MKTEKDLKQTYYVVICTCNTEVEVKESTIVECPNCGREIDDRGVIV